MKTTKLMQGGGYRAPSMKIFSLTGKDEIVRTSLQHEQQADDIFGIRDGVNGEVQSRFANF